MRMTDSDIDGSAPAAPTIGSLPLWDDRGTAYTFAAYPVRACPDLGEAVFALCRLEGILPVPCFVGTADAVDTEAVREAAIGMGAVYLLVHRPEPGDPVDYREAASRLARAHRPPLNRRVPGRRAASPPPLDQQAASRKF